jgi:hypothetical protein
MSLKDARRGKLGRRLAIKKSAMSAAVPVPAESRPRRNLA